MPECVHVCVHVCMCVYTCVHACVYMCVCVCVCTCVEEGEVTTTNNTVQESGAGGTSHVGNEGYPTLSCNYQATVMCEHQHEQQSEEQLVVHYSSCPSIGDTCAENKHTHSLFTAHNNPIINVG